MNHDDPRHRSPPRAEPIQPDRPGRGADKESGGSGPAPRRGQPGDTAGRTRKLKEQADVAVENVREGYGGD